jgi:hypothetical protein
MPREATNIILFFLHPDIQLRIQQLILLPHQHQLLLLLPTIQEILLLVVRIHQQFLRHQAEVTITTIIRQRREVIHQPQPQCKLNSPVIQLLLQLQIMQTQH